jgi:choline monooxygenase
MAQLPKTLPAEWYFDEGIYQRERATIFGRSWIYVAHTSELVKPGDYITSEIAGHPIFLIIDKTGALRGYHNLCRHRASPLLFEASGRASVGALVCPYHGWSYDLNGDLTNAPQFPDLTQEMCKDLSLHSLQVQTHRGLIFVNLAKDAQPFAEWLGPVAKTIETSGYPLESYTAHRKMVREGNFNWKTWMDGFQECYHCPTVHPAFHRDFKLKEYRIENREQYSIHSCERKTTSASGTFEGLWLWLFPNLGFPCYEPCYYTLQVNPQSSRKTQLTYTFHFRDADSKEAGEFMQFIDDVTKEDMKIVTRVQQNLEAGIYTQGVLNPDRENGVMYFHSLVRAACEGAVAAPR